MLAIFKTPILRRSISLIPLIGFLLVSCLYFGYGNFHTFNQDIIGKNLPDEYFYLWCLMWWPYALMHGLNPLLTQMAWAPTGINLAISTPIPGVALLAAPITLSIGVIAAYNTIAIITPGLAAWTMYLTCRYLTQETLPALFAGYLFGFCSYEVSHMLGHLNLTAGVFLLPLLLYCALKYLHHEIRTSWFIISSTLCATLLFLISTELFVVNALFSALAWLLAYWYMPLLRQNLLNLCKLSLCYYALITILVSPYLYYFFTVSNAGSVAIFPYYTDLLTLLVPTPLFWLSNHMTTELVASIHKNYLEYNAYIGLPLVIMMILFWRECKAQPYTQLLCWLTLITLILSLGSQLQIAGFKLIPILPWAFIFQLPIIKFMQFNRFGLFISAYTAIMLALWLKAGKTNIYIRYAIAVLAILFLIPSFNQRHRPFMNTAKTTTPIFFSQNKFTHYLKPHDNVLFLPYSFTGSPFVLWQAQSHFYFRMTNGLIWINPPASLNIAVTDNLTSSQQNLIQPAAFKQFIHKKQIDAIIVSDKHINEWQGFLTNLGLAPHAIDGVQIYRISRNL